MQLPNLSPVLTLKKQAAILTAIMILALIPRLIYLFNIPLPFYTDSADLLDPLWYTSSANQIIKGQFRLQGSNVFQRRYGVTLPTVLFVKLFGSADKVYSLWPMICSLGEIIVIFYLGRLMLSPLTGLIAAFLLAIFPMQVNYSAVLMPDSILSFFLAFCVLAFFKARESKLVKEKTIYYILSGILLFIAHTVKFWDIGIIFFLLAVTVTDWENNKYGVVTSLTFLVLLGLLYTLSYILTGDFWYTIKACVAQYKGHVGDYVFGYLIWFLPVLNNNYWIDPEFGIFPYLAVLVIIFSLLKKEKAVYPLLIWMISLYAMIEFTPSRIFPDRLFPYITLHKELRYAAIIIVPMVILIAHFISKCLTISGDNVQAKLIRISGWLILSAITVSSANCIAANLKFKNEFYERGVAPIIEMAEYIKNQPGKPKEVICLDPRPWRWKFLLNYYFKYSPDYQFKSKWNADLNNARGSYVITDTSTPENWKFIGNAGGKKLLYIQ